ncbi:uncharacterized protein LOC143636221 [Bidens hawaiensis]|uniref:uncharacterized protein LOC143636221 n=1 Tax=Bidens hawaiensis TaxID=980011 RepID=UPI00404B37CD
MKIHPTSNKQNNIIVYDPIPTRRQKKLQRLPHIFSKVLELPFYSDAVVSIQETSDSLKFVVETDDNIGGEIAARAIEISPGVIKVVVRPDDGVAGSGLVDLCRVRLPECTVPEMATAVVSGGEVVVTVPKDVGFVLVSR